MTLKERLMKDSWDYDFPLSNRQAESIVNMMDNLCIEFVDSIIEYEKESGNQICNSDYTTRELLKIFKKNQGL
jgi:hypothetical protein